MEDRRSSAERLIGQDLGAEEGVGRPISERARLTPRSVESYLEAGVRPRWMERLIECDECGEAISAADDEELRRRLAAHLSEEHGLEPDADEIAELVEGEAYDAMDS